MNKLYFILSLALIFLCGSFFSNNASYAQETDPEDPVGFLRINITNVDSAYVTINDDFGAVLRIASGDTLTLPAGTIHVRIIKQYYMDQTSSFNIKDGETQGFQSELIAIRGREQMSRRSSYPRLFWGGSNFILSDPETELFVNGEYVGTHFAAIDTTGRFEVTGVHASGARFTTRFTAGDESVFHYHQKHLQPSRTTSRALSFIPGGSQFHKKQNLKAVSIIAGILGGSALAYSYDSRFQQSYDEFNELVDQYREASNPSAALRLRVETQNALDDANQYSSTRDWFIYGTAALYFINIVDGFIAPSIGFRDKSRIINPYMDFDPVYRQPVIGFQTSF